MKANGRLGILTNAFSIRIYLVSLGELCRNDTNMSAYLLHLIKQCSSFSISIASHRTDYSVHFRLHTSQFLSFKGMYDTTGIEFCRSDRYNIIPKLLCMPFRLIRLVGLIGPNKVCWLTPLD